MIKHKILDLSCGKKQLDNGLKIDVDVNDIVNPVVLLDKNNNIVCRDSEECEVHLKNDEIVVLFSTETREAFNMSRSDFDDLAI